MSLIASSPIVVMRRAVEPATDPADDALLAARAALKRAAQVRNGRE